MSTDEPEGGWNPLQDRRRFLLAAGAAGAAGLSGCGGDGNPFSTTAPGDGAGGDGTGGNGDGTGGTDTGGGADGDGTGGTDTDGGADGDGTGGTDTDGGTTDDGDGGTDGADDGGDGATGGTDDLQADPESNPHIPPETSGFVLPSGAASTTFDATLQDEAVVIAGDAVEAVVDADTSAHTYTVDEDRLGGRLETGDVFLLSGVALRRVTAVDRDGTEATVETEMAPLNAAISDGTVAWDAEVAWDAAHSPADAARSIGGQGLPASALGGAGPDGTYFAGVEVVGTDGTRESVDLSEMATGGPSLEWTYTEADRAYTFALDVGSEEATIRIQVRSPASGDADLAYTAEGTVGTMRSVASAEYSDGELQDFELQQKDLAGDLTLSVAAAGSGLGSIDWTFPGLMFKYVVFAGPVPVTIGIETKLIGNITVPAKASAQAESNFTYRGEAGFKYTGTSVDADAQLGSMQFDPEPADSAGNIGSDVDVQFGVAFPRIQVSVFDQGIIPYVHAGVTIGSSLTWGPVCKRSYVRFVVQAGYDLAVLGVSLGSEKVTLYEDQKRAKGDSCG